MCDTMRGNTVCGGFRMNGKFEGSRVDDMNDLKMVSSNIAKSCIYVHDFVMSEEKKAILLAHSAPLSRSSKAGPGDRETGHRHLRRVRRHDGDNDL